MERAKSKEACQGEFEKASKSESAEVLLQVVKENFEWCWVRNVIDTELLEKFGDDLLWAAHIYTKGEHQIELTGSEKATVWTLANSSATVETRENSVVRDLTKKKVYIYKDAFEIVQYEQQ